MLARLRLMQKGR
ncbi:hypothetical protein C2C75_16425 [Escherichia coli]|nr:hypothetical protein [Escherichia coli]